MNDKIKINLQIADKNLEPEKIIAMVAYQFSLERLQLMQRNDTSPYVEKVKELTELLEDYFKEE